MCTNCSLSVIDFISIQHDWTGEGGRGGERGEGREGGGELKNTRSQ